MRITVLCSDRRHPVNAYLERWATERRSDYAIELVHRKAEARGGDILFLVSCAEIVTAQDRSAYTACLVLHASDLPQGRGWSPHVWEISRGAGAITLCLLEAEDKVDSGRIWKKHHIPVPKHALWHEINALLFEAEILLIDFAIENFQTIAPRAQPSDVNPRYYRRRSSQDSQIDPNKTIVEQFDLIRVCDPDRFPAFSEHLAGR